MSYDVSLYEPGWDTSEEATEVFAVNYTSNLAGCWRAAGVDLREWHDRTAGELVEPLAAAIAYIDANLVNLSEIHNPENGWGHVSSMLTKFLIPIREACEQHPTARIGVWS